MAECPACGREFKSKYALRTHGIQAHEDGVEGVSPWRDEELLRELYLGRRMSVREVADEFGCHKTTVQRWMGRFDIEARDRVEECIRGKRMNPVPYRTDMWGYETWRTEVLGDAHVVRVHRLVVVAEEGVDAVDGKVVHHENHIPWDNRPENLSLMDAGEHSKYHAAQQPEF